MRLNAFELQRYLSACAGKADCKVVYEHNIQPRTDGKTIWLPFVNMFTTNEFAEDLIHFVNHETSHIRYTAFDGVPEYEWMSPMSSLLGLMWGVLEDNRVDYLNDRIYQGDRDVSMAVIARYRPDFVKNIQSWEKEDKDRLMSVLLLHEWVRTKLYPNAWDAWSDIHKLCSDEAKAYFKKMIDLGIDEDMHKAKSIEEAMPGTRSTAAVCQDIWVRVFNDNIEDEKKKAEARAAALKNGGKEGDEITVSPEGHSDDGSEVQDGGDSESTGLQGPEQDDTNKTVADPEFKIKLVDYSKGVPESAHNHEPNGSIHNTGLKLILPNDHDSGEAYDQVRVEDYPVLDFKNPERSTINSGHESWVKPDSLQAKEYMSNITSMYSGKQLEGFANQLRRLIQIRSKGRYEYGQKRGKLQRSAVHRVTVPDSPLSQKIFKKHVKSNVDDCAITILVDASGSMAGTKYLHAACAMMILSDTIANVLRIPLEVLAFTDGMGFNSSTGHKYEAEDMFLVRQFSEQRLSKEELVARMATVSQFMGANADGEAIVFALDRLLKQKQKRKLLIVLSDGQPVSSATGGNIRAYTKRVVEAIDKTPDVTAVGIGIMSEEVTKYYKHNRVIQDSKEIEGVLLEVLREAVLDQTIS